MPFYHPTLDNRTKLVPPSSSEAVNHPNHYLGNTGHEVIDVIQAWDMNFNKGNAIKYIARSGRKNPAKTIEDLEKAIFYLNYEINSLKQEAKNEKI